MSWVDNKEKYQAIVSKVEPSAKLTTKDSWFWKVLAVLVHVFTFGGTTRKKFLENYGTTIGPVIASPRSWSSLSEGYIVHEGTHAADMRKAGLGIHPWIGLPIYSIFYLLLFLPVGFAWFRYWLELRADISRWKYELTHASSVEQIRAHAIRRGSSLKGGAYGYAWLWAASGYRKKVETVIKEVVSSGYKVSLR